MKKLMIITAMLFTYGFTMAQYFQHKYLGPTLGTGKMSKGFNVRNSSPLGHFMVGTTSQGKLQVIRTDASGDIPASTSPFFNKVFSSNTITSTTAVELNNGDFAIAGTMVSPARFFLLIMNSAGTVSFVQGYNRTGGNTTSPEVTQIIQSQDNNYLYLCGNEQNSMPFVMKLDMSGTVVWANAYTHSAMVDHYASLAYGIVETVHSDVIPGQLNGFHDPNEVVVAGRFIAGPDKAMIMRINKTTGAHIITHTYSAGYQSNGFFTSIKRSDNTVIGTATSNKFILSGEHADANGMESYWFTSVDQMYTPVWSSLFNMPSGSYCKEAMERVNSAGAYEYYVAGDALMSTSVDVVIVKADNVGVGIPNGQFKYTNGFSNKTISIDQYNNSTADGLSIFADALGTSASNHYMIKAYFSGDTYCNSSLSDPVTQAGPNTPATVAHNIFCQYQAVTVTINNPVNAGHLEICNGNIPGSNYKTEYGSNNAGNGKDISVSPNPLPADLPSELTVKIADEQSPEIADISITDMLGRKCFSGKVTASAAGEFTLPLKNLDAGTYVVLIKSPSYTHWTKLLVK